MPSNARIRFWVSSVTSQSSNHGNRLLSYSITAMLHQEKAFGRFAEAVVLDWLELAGHAGAAG
jgi:hypothetical protein